MAEAQRNGDNLVKVSKEQSGKLRNLLKKVINGVKTVPYLPKAILTVVKTLPSKISETAEQMKEADQKRQNEDNLPENDKTNSGDQGAPDTGNSQGDSTDEQKDKDQDGPSAGSLPVVDQRVINNAVAQAQAITDGIAPADSIVGSTNKTTQKDNSDADQNANTIGTQKISVIEAKNLRELPGFLASLINSSEDNSKNSTDKVNSTVFPAATIVTSEKGDASAVVSEDTDQAKLEESIKRYGDLMRFNTWDDYYKSFSDEEIRELCKQGKSVLSGPDFTNIRLKQFQLSLSIATAVRDELQTQATSLEKDIGEKRKKMEDNENSQDALGDKLTALVNEHRKLEMEKSNANDKLKNVRADILTQDAKIKKFAAVINNSNKQSSYIDRIVREETDKLEHQQGDTTATTSSGNESLDSPLVSGMNNMGVSQGKTTGLLEEMDALLNDNTSVSTERSDTDEEVAPVTSEVIPQNGNDSWKTGSEAPQKNGNTGLYYMDLDAEQIGALYQRLDEIVQGGNNNWTDALNQAEAEFGIDSDAKGRTR